MVRKCLNPLCATLFHYLRGGKLFLVNSHDYRGVRKDLRHRGTEYFWLFESCALRMTLNLKGLKPEVIPLPNQAGAVKGDHFLLQELSSSQELSKVLKEGVCDLNQAAERLSLPLQVVQRTFHDGLLKGYWKVADGQLFIHSTPAS